MLLDCTEVIMMIVQTSLHSNAAFAAKLVIFNVLQGALSGSKTVIWGDTLEVRMMDVQQPFESLVTTSRLMFDMLVKLRREHILGLQFREDFLAAFVEVRLKEL